MVHAILNLNHAAAIIDGVGHAVKRRTGALHGDFRPKRHRRRRGAGVLARIELVSERVKKTALHRVRRRIIRRKQRLYGVRCRAARLRAGIVRYCVLRRYIVQRIDRRTVQVHTKMQVTAGRVASCTNGRDFLTGGDFCALGNIQFRTMSVETHQTAAMVNTDVVTITSVQAGYRYSTRSKRKNRSTRSRSKVYTVMKLDSAVNWVYAVSVTARNARVGRTRPNIFTHVLPSLTRQLEHSAGINPPTVTAA